MVALHYLKYQHDLSDEDVVALWIENPYWVRRRNRQGVGGASPLQ
jgi:IS5 family transposase